MDEPLERLQAELTAARARAEEYLGLARRSQSELTSYRRRVQLERADDHRTARAAAVEELLPLLDDLDRALEHLPPDLAEHPWARGVMLVGLHLQSALIRLGVERIGAAGGPFDPALHEAIAHEPREDVPPDHVARIVRPGYRSGDRLLRAAQVVVAREPEPAPAAVADAPADATAPPAAEPGRDDTARAEPPPRPEPGTVIDRRA